MLKLFKRLGKKQLFYTILCVIFVILNVYFELRIPDYMSKITVLVEGSNPEIKSVLMLGTRMVLCALLSLIASLIVGYFASVIAATFGKVTRRNIFEKVNEFSKAEIKKFSTSSLITRTTNDVNQVQMLIAMGLQAIVKAPIMATLAITKIAGKNYAWSLATFIGVVILLGSIILILVKVFPKFKLVQKLTDNLNRIMRENLTGVRVVRAFNAEDYQQKRFERANEELKNTQLYNQKRMGLLFPTMDFIMHTLSMVIYVIGAYLIMNANGQNKILLFGDMVVFSTYAVQVLMSFMMLVIIFFILPRASVSAKRINEVLECDSSVIGGNVKDKNEIGTIEFKNVSFRYPDAKENILENISFKVKKGETVGFIGSTGSGKSTLANLIPRMYDATEGEVLIDGTNVKEYDLEYLHYIIGFIPQRAVIFSGTVASNVRFGNTKKEVSDKKVKEAIEIAQAKSFVEKMDGKYDASIARSGTNISGGQKQRLAIARAIARDPEIYVFDDSFSALDNITDFTLRKELKNYTKEATTVIVASRIGTIKDADKIIVLDNGKCVGIGTHSELLKKCKKYKEIALSQLGEEALKNEK